MPLDLGAVLGIILRWLHIISAIALLGGMLYSRYVVTPAISTLVPELQQKLGDSMARRYQALLYTAIGALLVSGTYNLLHKTGLTPLYHALFGIKILLALHVFVVGFLAMQPGNKKRARQITGIVISGILIVAISAVLRKLSS